MMDKDEDPTQESAACTIPLSDRDYKENAHPTSPIPFHLSFTTYLHQHFFGAFALVIDKAQDLGKLYNPFRIRNPSTHKIYWQK